MNREIKGPGTSNAQSTSSGPGTGGPGPRPPTPISKASYTDSTRAITRDEEGIPQAPSASFRSRAASRANGRRPETPNRSTRRRAPATRSPRPRLRRPPSTTPDLLGSAASVGDGEARNGPAGNPLALRNKFSTPGATARSCRSSTSTATRSPTHGPGPAIPRTSLRDPDESATATSPYFRHRRQPGPFVHPAAGRHLDTVLDEIPRHPGPRPAIPPNPRRAAAVAP